jgi:predicted dehydrogenase
MGSMNAIRAAVIGVGYFGSRHADKLARLPGVKLEYVVDTDLARAEAVAGKTGARAVADFRAVLGGVDIATVAVPTQAHAEVAGALLGAGIHVLVEKPLTATLAEADRVVGAAAAQGLVLRVGHLERFNPALLGVRERITAPRFIEAHRLAPFKPRGTDVDVILDLMIHDLQILHAFDPSPVAEVRATGIAVLSPRIDIANVRIELASGGVASLTASRVSSERVRKLRAFLPNRYYSLDYQAQEIKGYRLEETGTQRRILPDDLPVVRAEPLRRELEAFLAACRGEDAPRVDGAQGRRALATALAVVEAIR